MRKQITLEEAVGKILEGEYSNLDNGLILTFSGGTFVFLTQEYRYGDAIGIRDTQFDLFDIGRPAMWVDVCTESEFNSLYAEREAQRAKDNEQRERAQYEALKAKFGDK